MFLTFPNSCKDKEQINTKVKLLSSSLPVLSVTFPASVSSLTLISHLLHNLNNFENAYLTLNIISQPDGNKN